MEFISAEEFRKQPVEVQKHFIDWWKPSIGDLVSHIDNINDNNLNISIIVDYFSYGENWRKYPIKGYNIETNITTDISKNFIPLLTEGQLRKFIEDKTEYRVDCCLYEGTYDINICENNGLYIKKYEDIDKDLLQAYWKVAIQIAEQL